MSISLRSRRPARAAWPLALLALLGVGAAALSVRAADDKTAGAAPLRPALTVVAVSPQRAELDSAVQASGSIAAWQEAVVGAEGNGWRLAEVRVNVGDRVRRGQLLARFDAALPQAELAQSQAAVAEAEAVLAEAAANAQRARELGPSGVLTTQQVQQSLTAERTAQARLEALRAALAVQQLRLQQAQVLAPDDGVISARGATVGAVAPPGSELFRLIRKGRLEWRAEVAVADLARIQPGQAVRVLPAGGAPLAGRVRQLAPTVDVASRNGLVYVDLPAAVVGAAGARPGAFASGEFVLGRSAALTLPQTAVLLRDGFAVVMRIGADQKVTQTKVRTGRRADQRIEILDGLDAGARVVLAGAGFLSDGDTVRVVDAPPPLPPAAAGSAAR